MYRTRPRLHARFRAGPADRFLATWWLTFSRSMPSVWPRHTHCTASIVLLGEKRGPRYGFVTTARRRCLPDLHDVDMPHPRAHSPPPVALLSSSFYSVCCASAHMMSPSDLLSPWLWACARHRVGTCKSTQPRSQYVCLSGDGQVSARRRVTEGRHAVAPGARVRTHDLMSMDGTPRVPDALCSGSMRWVRMTLLSDSTRRWRTAPSLRYHEMMRD